MDLNNYRPVSHTEIEECICPNSVEFDPIPNVIVNNRGRWFSWWAGNWPMSCEAVAVHKDIRLIEKRCPELIFVNHTEFRCVRTNGHDGIHYANVPVNYSERNIGIQWREHGTDRR